ncbi:hypothetical protein HOD29_05300 [archaeon]|jgi:hypothetical protein|nr:hypothetical protein [archaeon]
MKIVGFNFTKIKGEKYSDNFKELKVNTQIDIVDILEIKSDVFKSKENLIAIKFNYSINYQEKVANIEFEGNIMLALESKLSKSVINDWKDKKVEDKFRLDVFNMILRKSNIKALNVEEELGLPFHFKLPVLKIDNKE